MTNEVKPARLIQQQDGTQISGNTASKVDLGGGSARKPNPARREADVQKLKTSLGSAEKTK